MGPITDVVQPTDTIALLGNSIMAQNRAQGGGFAEWASNIPHVVGDKITPTYSGELGGFVSNKAYQCTVAGTTATSYLLEPYWPTAINDTVTDGTVVWTAISQFTNCYYTPRWFHMANALSGQRLNPVVIMGLSGQRVADIAARLPRVLAYNPSYVFCGHWLENDIWPGGPPTLANIEVAWQTQLNAMESLRTSGIKIVLTTCLPNIGIDNNGSNVYTQGLGTQAWYFVNNKIREYARKWRNDVIFYDVSAAWVDPNTANPVWPENAINYVSGLGSGQNLHKTDGIHPYQAAAYIYGQGLAAVIEAAVPFVEHFTSGANDYLNAHPNPMNYGQGGAVLLNGVAQATHVANSMEMQVNDPVGTVTASQVARTDIAPAVWQQGVYSSTGSTTGGNDLDYDVKVPLTTAAMGWTAGTTIVEGISEIKVLANPTLLACVYLWVQFSGATDPQNLQSVVNASTDQDLGQFITVDTVFTLRTPPVILPPGTNTVQWLGRATTRGANNITAQFGRSIVRQTVVPEIAP